MTYNYLNLVHLNCYANACLYILLHDTQLKDYILNLDLNNTTFLFNNNIDKSNYNYKNNLKIQELQKTSFSTNHLSSTYNKFIKLTQLPNNDKDNKDKDDTNDKDDKNVKSTLLINYTNVRHLFYKFYKEYHLGNNKALSFDNEYLELHLYFSKDHKIGKFYYIEEYWEQMIKTLIYAFTDSNNKSFFIKYCLFANNQTIYCFNNNLPPLSELTNYTYTNNVNDIIKFNKFDITNNTFININEIEKNYTQFISVLEKYKIYTICISKSNDQIYYIDQAINIFFNSYWNTYYMNKYDDHLILNYYYININDILFVYHQHVDDIQVIYYIPIQFELLVNKQQYKLYTIIDHINNNHFVATCHIDNNWYLFDSNCTQINLDIHDNYLKSTTVHTLVYKLVK